MKINAWLNAIALTSSCDRGIALPGSGRQRKFNSSGPSLHGRRNITKTLLVMKLTTLFLTLGFLQLSAKGMSQSVTLSVKQVQLEQVFAAVKKQTGYFFFYDKDLVKELAPVSVEVKNMELNQFLSELLKNIPLKYSIKNKNIIVSRKWPQTGYPPKINPPGLHETNTGKNTPLHGIVRGADGKPLAGATVRVKGKNLTAVTDESGSFELQAATGDVLIISYIGFEERVVKVNNAEPLLIVLNQVERSLDTAEVVLNTGYQQLLKERATGSFVFVERKMIERTVSTNMLDRLTGITSGLLMKTGLGFTDDNRLSAVQIRGKATLGAYSPLLVVDNFVYDGEITNINPNDIESITILKDAAAAAVWGARAGNGVIVITTKTGRLNSRPRVSVTSNVQVSEKPDLYAASLPQITNEQYIEAEQLLFRQGAYNSMINAGFQALSPAIEIFLKRRNGLISAGDSLEQINQLKTYDSRQQLLDYYYQRQVNQQYQASISGGGSNNKYFFSAGYDVNQGNTVNNKFERLTLNATNSYYLLNNKLEFNTNIMFTSSRAVRSYSTLDNIKPYVRLADEAGNPLPIEYYQSAHCVWPIPIQPAADNCSTGNTGRWKN
jgi:TonB-dependent outer membrane receptor, SusC/RagA subfamily, signature region